MAEDASADRGAPFSLNALIEKHVSGGPVEGYDTFIRLRKLGRMSIARRRPSGHAGTHGSIRCSA